MFRVPSREMATARERVVLPMLWEGVTFLPLFLLLPLLFFNSLSASKMEKRETGDSITCAAGLHTRARTRRHALHARCSGCAFDTKSHEARSNDVLLDAFERSQVRRVHNEVIYGALKQRSRTTCWNEVGNDAFRYIEAFRLRYEVITVAPPAD